MRTSGLLALLLLAAPAQAALVQGHVKDQGGSGAPNVSVKFTGNVVGARPALTTNAAGFYSADLPLDTYRVSFIPTVASRLVADRRFNVVVAADTVVPDVTLEAGALVSGLVTNGVGTPVANVDLTFENRATGHDVFTPNDNTDAAGHYAIVVPAADYDIEFSPPEFPPLVSRLLENVAVGGDTLLATVVLPAGVVVNGVVEDEVGTPVAGVRLDFYDAVSGDKVFTTNDVTNEFGVYRVVVDPATYEIRYLPPSGGRLLPARLFDVVLASDTTLFDVVLEEGFALTGLVVDAADSPIPGVDLDVFPAGTTERLLTPGDDTGADGRYRLVVPGGTFDLRYNPPPGSPYLRVTVAGVSVTGDLERPDVVLPDAYLVSGRMVNMDGQPIEGVDLDFVDTTSGQALILQMDDSGPDGTFSIAVPPGSYHIRFAPLQASNYLPLVMENETIGADRDLGELQLESGWAIFGRVVDAAMVGIPGVDLDVLDGSQSVYIEYDETDALGDFRVVVGDGSYRVRFDPGAASPYFSYLTDEIEVTGNVNLGLVELSTGIVVDGLVEDQHGAPVAGATVSFTLLNAAVPLGAQAVTDAAGHFEATIGPGSYDVRYDPPSSYYSSYDAGSMTFGADTTLPTVVLVRQPVLTGRAIDDLAAPVADADVDVLEVSTGNSVPLSGDLTDAAGQFSVAVPDGSYRVRIDPPPGTDLFPVTSAPLVVSGDTDAGDLVLPRGALVSGQVTDPAGTPIGDVQVGVSATNESTLKTHLTVTDRGGQYEFLVAPDEYLIWFDPPPGAQFFPAEIGPLLLATTVDLGPTALERGWFVSGRTVDGAGTAVAAVDIDLLLEATGASIPLSDDDTAGDGRFQLLVHAGTYRVRAEPVPATRLLPVTSGVLTVGPNADVGDLLLAAGHLVEGDVFDDGAQGLLGVDIDLVDVANGIDALLVGDRTDAAGHFATAAAAGDYFAEYKPPAGTRWIAQRSGPHAVAGDTLLPPVQLASGFLVSGFVVDDVAAPLDAVETRWLGAGSCEVIFTVRDSTDSTGYYQVALPSGSFDVIFDPPPGSGVGGKRLAGVVVAGDDVVLPTQTLSAAAPPLERCNGVDDDCDGVADESYPGVGSECSLGLGACMATGFVVCSSDGLSAACDAEPGTPAPEACDGVDNDCDGVVDNACAGVAFDVEVAGTGLSWQPLTDALHYDVVRGGLVALRSGGLLGAGEACAADDLAATSFDDGMLPAPGAALWYLVRGNTAGGAGSWGSAARDQQLDACLP